MDILTKLRAFISDLRDAGLPVGISQQADCFQALLIIDWDQEQVFYTTLCCTLLKESAYLPIFDAIYTRHFHSRDRLTEQELGLDELNSMVESLALGFSKSKASQGQPQEKTRDGYEERKPSPEIKNPRQKNPLTQDFYEATYQSTPDELRRMEQMVPLLAKRMAAKMVMKKKHNQAGTLDFRKTMRMSLSHGGVPIDLAVKRKHRENPVIFALCDVSWSCLQFSYFSLAIVYALEKFFRSVRSFAFIGQVDEITAIVKRVPYQNLRAQTLGQANVGGKSGYTDYGTALQSFYQQYGRELTPRSSVLIFGDARTNWFGAQAEMLREIKGRVKRIYWFNPEPETDWGSGDSSILDYKPYCHKVFECSNLEQLAQAICEID